MSSTEHVVANNLKIHSEQRVSYGVTSISLTIRNIAEYGGKIREDTPKLLEPYMLFVNDQARGHGIGEMLVRRLTEEAKKLGVEAISGHIESEYALDIRARIFGSEAIKFYLDYPTQSQKDSPEQYEELPITFEQARASLVRARECEKDLNHREIGFDTDIDISSRIA